MRLWRKFKTGALALGLAGSLLGLASAQTLSPDDSPISEPVQVKVDRLILEGNTVLPNSTFQDILDGYQGRLLSFEDIRRVAEAVVTRYREHDYLTVSAYLPEQNLSSGEVTIKVVEAKVGKVTVEGAKHYDPQFVKWMFDPALDAQRNGDALLKRSDVQRQLLLINDNLDLSARSVFREGSREGEVDLVLQVEDDLPLHLTLDYNNLGARTTGRNRLGAGFEWGDLSGRGDVLNLRFVESGILNPNNKGVNIFSAGYTAPLNNRGTYLDFSYANSAFQVGEELQILDIRGNADVIRAGIRHQIIRSTSSNLEFSSAFVLQNIENTILGQQFSRDRLREVVLGVSGDWASGSGRNYGSLQLTQDLGELAGGTKSDDPFASRGAGGGFTKLNLDLSRVQRLSDWSYLVVRGRHQAAFNSLPYAEQFGLGGISSVRGHVQSSYLGDTGYSATAELRFAPIASNRQLFEIGAFIDHGGAALKNPIPGEIPNASLTGAGITTQFRLPGETYIRADVGWPLGNKLNLGTNSDDGPVPYLIFSKRF